MNNKINRELANCYMNASGRLVKIGEDIEKKRILEDIVPEKYAIAHKQRLCHMHDLEFYNTTYNCIGINVQDLLGEKEYSFSKAVRKLNREIIALTNLQSGGIGFLNFDEDMSKYVVDETIEELADELLSLIHI